MIIDLSPFGPFLSHQKLLIEDITPTKQTVSVATDDSKRSSSSRILIEEFEPVKSEVSRPTGRGDAMVSPTSMIEDITLSEGPAKEVG